LPKTEKSAKVSGKYRKNKRFQEMSSLMRVMTFNLRFENDTDGPHAWDRRREMVVDVIRRYQPAVVGTQEGKWSQLTYLLEELPDYEAVMPGRLPDKNIQCPTLFFRKADVAVKDGSEFWLSETPEVHLSKSWDSAFPRMISFADVRIEGSSRKMIAAVTHLDHMGEEARYRQAQMISQWANRQPHPVILMGDFNDSPGSRVHDILTYPETDLHDTWELAGGGDGEKSFTHHGFTGIPQKSRLDWILVDSNFQVRDARIIRDHFNDAFPSDHYPYMADVTLPA
jgi:endonuclease/exonuclease/phosphatase family metal-dependent hydrolase